MTPAIRYLNTDLDLTAPVNLRPLVAALEQKGYLILSEFQPESSTWQASLETGEVFREAEPNIVAILTSIENLPPDLRALWDSCTTRALNVGYDCGVGAFPFIAQISTATLTRMGTLGASLQITLSRKTR